MEASAAARHRTGAVSPGSRQVEERIDVWIVKSACFFHPSLKLNFFGWLSPLLLVLRKKNATGSEALVGTLAVRKVEP